MPLGGRSQLLLIPCPYSATPSALSWGKKQFQWSVMHLTYKRYKIPIIFWIEGGMNYVLYATTILRQVKNNFSKENGNKNKQTAQDDDSAINAPFNTLRPRQNGRHFADDIFKCIFLNEYVWISIKISLKFVPKVRINNIPELVQIVAWRRPGDKPLSESMLVRLPTHICITRPQWVKTADIATVIFKGKIVSFLI